MVAVRWLLCLMLVPWVFVPSGLCVCHAGEQLLSSSEEGVNDSDHDHEPDDHAPGCPSRKLTDGQCLQHTSLAKSVDLTFSHRSADTLPPCRTHDHLESTATDESRPTGPCIYLTVRALLI